LVGNGLATEIGILDSFHFRKRVEPGKHQVGALAVSDEVIELGADAFGEAGDFADIGT
jgi:hypothetical protein